MKSFPAGVTITLTLPIIDMNGDPVTPTELSYLVRDLDDEIVVAPTNLDFASTDTDADITILATFNDAAVGAAAGRTVELKIKSAAGTFVQSETYALRPYQRLIPPLNSFLTDAAAQVMLADIPGLDALAGAEATIRQAALIEAHTRITKIPVQAAPYEMLCPVPVYDRHTWPDVSAETFRAFNGPFKKALMRAQLHEANQMLTGDPMREKRRAGILSETIGESSVTFQSGGLALASNAVTSSDALAELSGYIVRRAVITRT